MSVSPENGLIYRFSILMAGWLPGAAAGSSGSVSALGENSRDIRTNVDDAVFLLVLRYPRLPIFSVLTLFLTRQLSSEIRGMDSAVTPLMVKSSNPLNP